MFLELGTEIFIFQINRKLAEQIVEEKLWCEKTRVNFFLISPDTDELRILGNLIREMKEEWYKNRCSKVNVYSPSQNVCNELGLQGLSNEWYNFYINLWDELMVDGMEKQLEYTFIELNSTTSQFGQYAVELFVQDEFSVCFSVEADRQIFERTAVYSDIYMAIHTYEDYQKLHQLTEGDQSRRKRIYLNVAEALTDACDVMKDGFAGEM